MDQPKTTSTETPPKTIPGILRRLGPGLIIAGSIVGSGELVATTKTGAQAGFWLLWLIIVGCVIKVFTQVEFGRYTISSGQTTMAALDEVPGPRLRVNWVLWYWLVMFVVSLAQLGGIVQGVGQSLAMSLPIDGSFNRLLHLQDVWDEQAAPIRDELHQKEAKRIRARLRQEYSDDLNSSDLSTRMDAEQRIHEKLTQQMKRAQKRLQERLEERMGGLRPSHQTPGCFWTDDIQWAAVVTLVTVVILVVGRYRLVQNLSTAMVAAFTGVTVFTVVAIEAWPHWAVTWSELKAGLSFRLPPVVTALTKSPLTTALASFGIIGVGANELIAYPYWCLEKGYARFTGPRDDSPSWADRARGWMRVMRWDAMISMVVYTFATVAFYLLGAAVLHRQNLDPEADQMVLVLSQMYVPVFGSWARWLFLFGAFAVLYSTFFVAHASHARVTADAVRVFRFGARTERARLGWVRAFCVLLPLVALAFCIFLRRPAQLILASGVMQGIMLPMLAGATLYHRYRRSDPRITPGRAWDVFLWISAVGLLVAGAWMALIKVFPVLERVG